MLLQKLAHIGLSKSNWYAVDASFDARSKVVRLQGILSAKLASSLGDYHPVSIRNTAQNPHSHALSS